MGMLNPYKDAFTNGLYSFDSLGGRRKVAQKDAETLFGEIEKLYQAHMISEYMFGFTGKKENFYIKGNKIDMFLHTYGEIGDKLYPALTISFIQNGEATCEQSPYMEAVIKAVEASRRNQENNEAQDERGNDSAGEG